MIQKRLIGSAGLDALLGGGIPEDRGILVVGGLGTGKTTIGIQFLLEGAATDEHGLHILLEESPYSLTRRYDFLNWRGKEEVTYRKALEAGKITILDLLSARIGYREQYDLPTIISPPIFRLGDVLGGIYDTVRDHDIKRIVIDSLQSFFLIAEREVVQLREVLLAILEPYRRVRVGILATSERSITNGYRFAEHVFDGVISLTKGLANKPNARSLIVEKALWTVHDLRPHQFSISNSGIEVSDPVGTACPME